MTAAGGRLAGKVVIVTGASGGLGSYCAQGYAADGATVVAAARSQGATADGVTPIACDVGDAASVEAMAAQVVKQFGRIDVLMTNAVYYAPGTISTMALDDWERQFRVNVHGVYNAVRAVLPTMIAQGQGNIITISSVAAQRPSHYGVTKRAVEGMTEAFAEEQRPNGVAVNSLRPVAAIETPGWLNARDPAARHARAHRVSPPDSYVEAAILLAMRTVEETSGQAFTDAAVLRRFGDAASYERFKAMNAPVWASEG